MTRRDTSVLLFALVGVALALTSPGPAAGASRKVAGDADTDPCACIPKAVLPVALSGFETRDGWSVVFRTPTCPPVTEVRVGVDGGKPVSLGHGTTVDPLTGRPEAIHELFVEDDGGDHVLTVLLGRSGGKLDGPFTLRFSPREERLAAAKLALARASRSFVSFAEHGSVVTWLGFHQLFDLRGSLREVRYSINDCSLRERLVFSKKDGAEPMATLKGDDPRDLTFDRPFLSLPKATTRSVCVQAVFADDSLSELLELRRNTHPKP